MTKFILVGGYIQKGTEGGRAFAEELVKGFVEPVKILDCMFARPPEAWQSTFEADKEFFGRVLPAKKLQFVLADPDQFLAQVAGADAIFLRGGRTDDLLKLLAHAPDWVKNLKGKTVAGTSAGADALATYFYSLDDLKLGDGLGLVSVKTIPHFRSDYNAPNIDWDKAEAELKAYKDDLPLVTLREGEFKVFEQ